MASPEAQSPSGKIIKSMNVYEQIFRYMDPAAAVFRVILKEPYKMEDIIVEDCNARYLKESYALGIEAENILHHSYLHTTPNLDPRWIHYIYQAAVEHKYIHGEMRSQEKGYYLEFSGGPCEEENTCWMVYVSHTKYKDENDWLKTISRIDELTGARNRNAYEERIKELEEEDTSVGVIAADLNGLKEMNDRYGHAKGDQLIRNAAAYLCTFTRNDLPYRTGGDEFVLLLAHISCHDLEEIVTEIRNDNDLSISCGSAYTDHSSLLQETIKKADADMYEDKKRYYENHTRVHVGQL